MFYTFHQNNSGGFFKLPAVNVVIEADNSDEADERAQHLAYIYFNGCIEGRDCSCCGDRWNSIHGWAVEMGDLVPSIYGEPIDLELPNHDNLADKFIPTWKIYYKNGTTKTCKFPTSKTKKTKRTKKEK